MLVLHYKHLVSPLTKIAYRHLHNLALSVSGKCVFATNSSYSLQHKAFEQFSLPEPELDYEYLCDKKVTEEIRDNTRRRKGVGDIDKVVLLYNKWKESDSKDDMLKKELLMEALKIPNQSHAQISFYGEEPVPVGMVGEKREFDFKPKQFNELAVWYDAFRTKKLGVVAGAKSYYLKGVLVHLEKALIRYTLNFLLKRNFELVSVPDILPPSVIKGCGMDVDGKRTQVYALNPKYYGDACLSGTAEMALAGLNANKVLRTLDGPIRMAAVSRCFRAEISELAEEKGIYRVHQFNKVEMFGLTSAEVDQSDQLQEEFLAIQKELFSSLGLHFQILDMPPNDLGAPAFRKYDIEAWMPGRGVYGEISSCSNCTDYQSRRLNIRYEDGGGGLRHAHTVNGTACAVPRMLIAIIETFQQKDGSCILPPVLKPYLGDLDVFRPIPKASRDLRHLTELPKGIRSERQNV